MSVLLPQLDFGCTAVIKSDWIKDKAEKYFSGERMEDAADFHALRVVVPLS